MNHLETTVNAAKKGFSSLCDLATGRDLLNSKRHITNLALESNSQGDYTVVAFANKGILTAGFTTLVPYALAATCIWKYTHQGSVSEFQVAAAGVLSFLANGIPRALYYNEYDGALKYLDEKLKDEPKTESDLIDASIELRRLEYNDHWKE